MNQKIAKLLLALLLLPALAFAQNERDVNVIPDNQRHEARFIPERRSNDRTTDSSGTGAIWYNTTTRQWKGDLGNGIFTFGSGGSEPVYTASANFVFAGPPSGSPAAAVFRALVAADVPNLDAGKITSGIFDSARIPNLDTAKITTGIFDAARIPNLDAGKITSGVFAIGRIPALNTIANGLSDGCVQSASGLFTSTGVPCGAGSGGITSLGGLTGAAQTFANDTNITITSSGTTHTLGWINTLAVTRGGTGASNASTARTNLGLGINSDVQAWDADLDSIAALAKTDNTVILANGSVWTSTALPSCSNATNSKLLYNTTTRTFSCGTDQSGSGATSPGGSDKNVQFNNAGAFGGIANNATATAMYLKQVSSGTPSFAQVAAAEISGLAASATTDTTNAANISSGVLVAARVPALSTLSGAVIDAQVPNLNTLGTGLADGCVEVVGDVITSTGTNCGSTPTIPTLDEVFDNDTDPTITGATEAKPFVISGNNPDYALVARVTTTNTPELVAKCGGVIGACDRVFTHNAGKKTSFLDESGNEDIRYTAADGILQAVTGQIIATSGDSATGFFTSGTIEAARLPAVVKSVQLTLFDYTTDVTTGTGKAYFRVPSTLNNYILTGAQANVITAGTTGTTTVRLTRCVAVTTGNTCSGTTVNMFTTDLSIDSGESDSSSAATPVVIDTADDDVSTGMVIRADVQTVSTTAPKGLIVNMDFSAP